MWKSVSSFCNDPWVYMMNRTGIIKEDLWGQEVVCMTSIIHIVTNYLLPAKFCFDDHIFVLLL